MIFFSLFVLAFAFRLLWKKESHNVLFWGTFIQWMSINIKLLYSIITNQPFIGLFSFPQNIMKAWLYSNIGLIFFCLGIFLLVRTIKYENIFLSSKDQKKYPNQYILLSILSLTILSPWALPLSLQQIAFNFTLILYSFFFLAMTALIDSKYNNYKLIIFIIFQILLSFSGYFSNFKELFIFIGIAYFYRKSSFFKVKHYFQLAVGVLFLFILGSVWSVVKSDYRKYITQGVSVQGNVVGREESLKYLTNRIKTLDANQLMLGSKILVDRISYIDYYSATIAYVAAKPRDEEIGNKLINAILFALQPRVLFPNKAITDDSQDLMKYTGLKVSGKESATSIGLTYMADGYIDFGINFFFITPLIVGLFIGFFYRLLFSLADSAEWALAITFPFYFLCKGFESPINKVLPPILYFSLVAFIFLRFIKRRN